MKASLIRTMKSSKSNPKAQKLLLNTFAFHITSYLSVNITKPYFKHYQATLKFYPAFLSLFYPVEAILVLNVSMVSFTVLL